MHLSGLLTRLHVRKNFNLSLSSLEGNEGNSVASFTKEKDGIGMEEGAGC